MQEEGGTVVGAYRNRLTCFARLKHSTNSNRAIERGSEWERGRVRQRHGSGCGRNRSLRAGAQKWRPHKSNVNCIEGTCIHAYTHAHTHDTHGSHAHTKGLALTLNKRKHTHPTVLCGISLYLFTLIGFQCVCRTVQTVSYKDGVPTSPPLPSPSSPLFPLPNTLPPLSRAAGKEEASAKGKYVCNLPFALPLVPYILSHVPLLC